MYFNWNLEYLSRVTYAQRYESDITYAKFCRWSIRLIHCNFNQYSFLQWINSEAKIFRKSYQSFLRIEFSDKETVNQKFLRPYDVSMPAKITIRNDGYKRFRNITVQTKVGFQVAYDLTSMGLMPQLEFNLVGFSNSFNWH